MKHLQLLIKAMSGTYPDTYFAGANTADGFRSDYSNYIQEEALTRLYILKGGSGTGMNPVEPDLPTETPIPVEPTVPPVGTEEDWWGDLWSETE